MSKKAALEKVKSEVAAQFPEDYLVGIENGHICIRHKQTNIADTLEKVFGGRDQALKMLENVKKGFVNGIGRNRQGNPAQEDGKEETNSGEDQQGTGTDEESGGVDQ